MARTITIVLIIALVASIGYISYSLYETRYGKSMDVALEQEQELQLEEVLQFWLGLQPAFLHQLAVEMNEDE